MWPPYHPQQHSCTTKHQLTENSQGELLLPVEEHHSWRLLLLPPEAVFPFFSVVMRETTLKKTWRAAWSSVPRLLRDNILPEPALLSHDSSHDFTARLVTDALFFMLFCSLSLAKSVYFLAYFLQSLPKSINIQPHPSIFLFYSAVPLKAQEG